MGRSLFPHSHRATFPFLWINTCCGIIILQDCPVAASPSGCWWTKQCLAAESLRKAALAKEKGGSKSLLWHLCDLAGTSEPGPGCFSELSTWGSSNDTKGKNKQGLETARPEFSSHWCHPPVGQDFNSGWCHIIVLSLLATINFTIGWMLIKNSERNKLQTGFGLSNGICVKQHRFFFSLEVFTWAEGSVPATSGTGSLCSPED